MVTSPNDLPRTVGELRASGHRERSVKAELRENLLAKLSAGVDVAEVWPGILGFEDTVIPQLERALIAEHDMVLLGERGQGKTRLLRALSGLLDEWTPVIAGAELGEHPYSPITPESIKRAADSGDDLPVAWKHRSERYTEKLATPDTSVADLVGDIDPIKVAEGRSLGDPETIAYGLIPRAHRGIVAVNELPDLAERIQVAMLNVMEERDIQVRGYTLRLPLDVLVVASANPEDYTNRGRIITPLKDRFGAEIRTHYPQELDAEVGVISQEAHLAAEVPDYLLQILARFARALRESTSIDQRSGVSARFAIAAAETVAASARHRGAVLGESDPVARVVDRLVEGVRADADRRPAQVELADVHSIECGVPCVFPSLDDILFAHRIIVKSVVGDIRLCVHHISLALVVRVLGIHNEKDIVVGPIDFPKS
uniref:sigma 54-interacting transcriptional regulator n=1 Tax=Mycolicibacterium poriferae TaxID=39694 RepID=UPI003219BEC7